MPAGSVAIGGAQTGIYPRELPGGWQIIGRTSLNLFDATRDEPALLHAGQRVRFVPVDPFVAMIHVVAPGLLTSVQDLGRRGFAHLGVGSAGAMDDVALRLANALVGNDDNAAALEITLRGPTLRFDAPALVAITGGEVDAPMWRPRFHRCRHACSTSARLRSGCRAYLAIAGGFRTPPLMGSRSVDINGGIGRALVAGRHACARSIRRNASAHAHGRSIRRRGSTSMAIIRSDWSAARISIISTPLRATRCSRANSASTRNPTASAIVSTAFRCGCRRSN